MIFNSLFQILSAILLLNQNIRKLYKDKNVQDVININLLSTCMNKNYKQSLIGQNITPKCFFVLDPTTSDCRRIFFKDCDNKVNTTTQSSLNIIPKKYRQIDNADPLPEMNFAPFDISELFGN